MFLTILLNLFFIHTSLVWGGKEQEDWAHHESLEKGDRYVFYWTVDKDIIRIKLEVAAKGWVGFGLSADGSLISSDVVIGGVNSKGKYLYDYHGDKKGKLNLDKEQNWKLESAARNKSFVVLKFTRKLDTCDTDDWAITMDTQRVLYAQSDEDQTSPGKLEIKPRMWKSISLKLIQARISMAPMPKGLRYWDVLAGNYSLPGNIDTVYYCKVFRGPPLEKKHHIIKVSPVIRKESLPFVHHLVLRKCTIISVKAAEEAVQYGGVNCFQPNIPLQFTRCNHVVHGWGVNGGSLIYPQHIGAPIGGEPNEYYMIQVHYDNSEMINGIMDNSGVRVYYTPHLRKFDCDLIAVGMIFQDYMLLPPRQKEFMLVGHTSPQCLRQTIPKTGMQISVAFLHTHLLGRKVRLRHFRGNKELPPIVYDMNYDFDKQTFNYLSKEVTVLPSDQLTLECTYETLDRNVTTFGGISTREEMCTAFLLIRPETDLNRPLSAPSLETLAGLTGMDLSVRTYNLTGAMGDVDMDYRNYLLNYDWTKSHICNVQNTMRFSPHIAMCLHSREGQYRVPRISYPEKLKQYVFPNPCKMRTKDPERNRMVSTCKDY